MKIESQNLQENMTKFLNTQKKPTNTDDLRLDAIIKEGKEGKIVIVGCPFDYVRKRAISKGGQENGPCCIRRFFYKVGPLYNSEYEINISDINISDYGNINPTAEQLQSPQRVISRIQTEIRSLLQNNQLPFVFGGSKESSLGCARAFHKQYKNGQHLIIAGMPFLRRAFDNDKLTSQNLMTILGNQFPGKSILFGPHEKYFPQNWSKNFQFVSYNEIYEYNQGQNQVSSLGFSHKPVKKLTSIWNKDVEYHLTLSVEAIQRFCGCRDLPLHGIKPQYMIEIFFWLGQQPNIKSIDITEFNPSCEDYESSLILINFLYYFLMGRTKRETYTTN